MTATPARWAALDVLRAVRRGELADRALAPAFERVPPAERPWLQELVYGTLRLRGRIDYLLAQHVRRGLDSLEPDVHDVLRLGAYQLLEMGSVPVYAAVSQAVEMAKSVSGRGAGGLVNGVLHALQRAAEPVFPAFERDAAAHLECWGSHPGWLIERWLRRFGAEETRALVEANNRRPELYLRPIGLEPEAAADALERAGMGAEPVEFAPDALRLLPPARATDALRVIPAVVQDPAAGLVVRYAEMPRGVRVADMCAAPGGKAVALACEVSGCVRRDDDGARVERGAAHGYVVAADLSLERLGRLRENALRLGGLPIGLVAADARRPPLRSTTALLLDVPCTGTGTLRRHPDGRWRVGPDDLRALVTRQRELLDAAALLLAPGGLLVYATCSLEPEENEEQVDAFLERHREFALEPPVRTSPALLDPLGRLVVLPQRLGVDGAFAARLRRSA